MDGEQVLERQKLGVSSVWYSNQRTWMGHHDLWKIHDHALVNIEENKDREAAEVDDFTTAWRDCLRLGIPWGGRGAGGRGIARVMNGGAAAETVKVQQITIALPSGKILLNNATLTLNKGERNALIGRNGVGKTTLLNRIAMCNLPGFPPWLKVSYVRQEVVGNGLNALDFVLQSDVESKVLKRKIAALEAKADNLTVEESEELADMLESLDALNEGDNNVNNRKRAEAILKKMKFSKLRMEGTPTEQLSGGWKMRLAIACALFSKPDVLLLDEPTNHLDLKGILWLSDWLNSDDNVADMCVLIVSHDRAFLNSCIDCVIEFKNQTLTYHPGNYDEFRQQKEQTMANKLKQLEIVTKQKEHLQEYIQTQQQQASSKHGDDKKARQVNSKQMKMKRLGAKRDDGKKHHFHNHGGYRDAVVIETDDKCVDFVFPEPASLGSSDIDIVKLSNISFAFGPNAPVLAKVGCSIGKNARIALVGSNGCGKTTLLNIIAGKYSSSSSSSSSFQMTGEVAVHPKVRIGYFTQHHVEALGTVSKNCVDYARERAGGDASDLDMRQYLGGFGIQGDLALHKVSTLSGGQKSRLALALLCIERPHLIILDEPCNHLDIDSIDALVDGVNEFDGAVIIVSHNQHLLTSCCEELSNSHGVLVFFKVEEQEHDHNDNDSDGGCAGSSAGIDDGDCNKEPAV